MATIHYTVYRPTEKGLPYIAVSILESSVEVLGTASSFEDAEKLAEEAYSVLEWKLKLDEKFGISKQTK